jgi:hypothetical protein
LRQAPAAAILGGDVPTEMGVRLAFAVGDSSYFAARRMATEWIGGGTLFV